MYKSLYYENFPLRLIFIGHFIIRQMSFTCNTNTWCSIYSFHLSSDHECHFRGFIDSLKDYGANDAIMLPYPGVITSGSYILLIN